MGRRRRAGPPGLLFVATDSQGKVNKIERKSIRSHVMHGKNTQSKSKPSCKVDSQQVESSRLSKACSGNENHADDRVTCIDNTDPIPRSANDFTLIRFCEELDDISRDRLFTYFSVVKQVMYPVDRCYSFNASRSIWFDWLLIDPAYLHSTLYTVSLFYDTMTGKKPGKATCYHLYKALKALNQRLEDEKAIFADSTTASVLALIPVSESFDNIGDAHTHMNGLQKIVHIRGGIDSFKHNPHLQDKILQIDFASTIASGVMPVFCKGFTSFDRAFEGYPDLVELKQKYNLESDQSWRTVRDLDARLGNIIEDVQEFSALANFLLQSGKTVRFCGFKELLTSIQYRLLYLQLGKDLLLSEILRLTMVAYMTSVLLNFSTFDLRFTHLATQLRAALQAFNPRSKEESFLYTWSLVMTAMSVLKAPRETWLEHKLSVLVKPCLGSTWIEAHDHLKQFLWVDALHDELGLEIIGKHIKNFEFEEYITDP